MEKEFSTRKDEKIGRKGYQESSQNIGHDELNLIFSKRALNQQISQCVVINVSHNVPKTRTKKESGKKRNVKPRSQETGKKKLTDPQKVQQIHHKGKGSKVKKIRK